MDEAAIKDVIESLGLPESDLYFFGDGSGTTPSLPCSFFVTAYDNRKKETKTFFGGFNHGTNNFAELMPYLHALWYYDHSDRSFPRKKTRVSIVSDSELTVNCCNGKYAVGVNLPLWSMMDWFKNNGFEISCFHVPRNSNWLMKLADKRASEVRRCIMNEIPSK